MIMLGTGNFCAAHTSGYAGFDTLGIESHSPAHGLFHRTAERDSLFQLSRNIFSDELSVDFRIFDFHNGDINAFTGHLIESHLQLIDFLALTADDQARFGSVNINSDFISGLFNFNLGNAGIE